MSKADNVYAVMDETERGRVSLWRLLNMLEKLVYGGPDELADRWQLDDMMVADLYASRMWRRKERKIENVSY